MASGIFRRLAAWNTESHRLNVKEGPTIQIGPSGLLEEVGMTT
jgi:hypothetical protein